MFNLQSISDYVEVCWDEVRTRLNRKDLTDKQQAAMKIIDCLLDEAKTMLRNDMHSSRWTAEEQINKLQSHLSVLNDLSSSVDFTLLKKAARDTIDLYRSILLKNSHLPRLLFYILI